MSNAIGNDPNAGSTRDNQQAMGAQNQIKHVIGIMSAKGGVGKSFVTGLLASELVRNGFCVGILDADFTGPSIPMLFGLNGPLKIGKRSFLPHLSTSGVKIVSIDSLIDDEEQSVIWKQSLMGSVIEELWKEVEWGMLDYLLLDLPPATSEVTVSILKSLPFDGAIIVSMPQKTSTIIASKAVMIAQKVNIPILGIVENMSSFICPDTGKEYPIFGPSNGEIVANITKVPLLTQIPLDPQVVTLCDQGKIEEVTFDQKLAFIESFYKSMSDQKEKATSLQIESQRNETEHPDVDGQWLAEDIAYSDSSSSQKITSVCNPYSDIVMHLIRSKENLGELDDPDAQGFFLGSCGDRMQIDLKIINNRIIEAKFVPEGCGVTLACGSMITKMACSKTLEQADQITPDGLISALDGLPEDHVHCAQLAVMTLKEAVIDAIEGHGVPIKKKE